jgi:predicted component of type VI protein secretion system
MSDRRRPHLRPAGRGKAAQAAARAQEKAQADAGVIRAALRDLGVAAGMYDPDDLMKLADLSALAVTQAGEVIGAAELVEALQKSKPYLFRPVFTSWPGRAPPSR